MWHGQRPSYQASGGGPQGALSRAMSATALWVSAAVLVVAFAVAISVVVRPAWASHATPGNKCSTSPTAWGFDRWHFGLWNFCQSDAYGPPEWMYWNYLPGTTGYNNPGSGPYYSYVAQGVSDWQAAQSNWKFTYQSGGWSSTTDLFFWSENLDPYTPYGDAVKGWTRFFQCTSDTSCTERTIGFGKYNLVYIMLDTSGVTQGVVSHEMGHAFGLVHPTNGDCFFTPTVMIPGCINYPSADDGTSVNNIYPDP